MEIRKNLETNFLTCRLCNEPFTEPKVMGCLHTFCKICLERLFEKEQLEAAKLARQLEQQRSSGYSSSSSTSRYRGRWTNALKNSNNNRYQSPYNIKVYSKQHSPVDEITCPICEKKTQIPRTGIHGLPDDQLSSKLAELVGTIPNYPTCDVCSCESSNDKLYSSNGVINHPSLVNGKYHQWTDIEEETTTDEQTSEDDVSLNNNDMKNNLFCRLPFARQGRSRPAYNGAQICNAFDEDCRPHTDLGSNVQPKQAQALCLDCGKRLCSKCNVNHLKIPITTGHVIVGLDQLESMRCTKHPRELRRFFCLTCTELICLVCTFENNFSSLSTDDSESSLIKNIGHTDHEIFSINQAIFVIIKRINETMFDCKQKAERMNNLLVCIKACERHVSSVRYAITSTADAFIEKINEQKQLMLNELDSDLGVNFEILSNECCRFTTALANWEDMEIEEDFREDIERLHPINALSESTKLYDQYLKCQGQLCDTQCKSDNWKKFITDLNNAEVISTLANNQNDTINRNELSDVSVENDKIKITKKVRFNQNEFAGVVNTPNYSAYWMRKIGKFIPSSFICFGRRVTPSQLAIEAADREQKFASKMIQASPTDIHGKPIPPERDTRRHRAIQADICSITKEDGATQTETYGMATTLPLTIKVDSGTQYQSSDINAPISFYRSAKKIFVQT